MHNQMAVGVLAGYAVFFVGAFPFLAIGLTCDSRRSRVLMGACALVMASGLGYDVYAQWG
jgi:hypothetical protein